MEYLLILLNIMCKVHAIPVLANSTGSWMKYRAGTIAGPTAAMTSILLGTLDDTLAHELLFIFLDFGAPHVLQSDNGREFTAQVITVTCHCDLSWFC